MNKRADSVVSGPIGPSQRRLRIVSLCIEYPNPHRRDQGLFVRTRNPALAAVADVSVLAPVALFEYSNPRQKWLPRGLPTQRIDEAVVVLHPRWMYPPFGTPLNVLCLFVAVIRQAVRLWRKGRCHLIDAHFGYPDGVAAALLGAVLRTPFIVTLRGNEPAFAKSVLRRWCVAWAFRRAGYVIAVSDQLRQFAIAHGADAGARASLEMRSTPESSTCATGRRAGPGMRFPHTRARS